MIVRKAVVFPAPRPAAALAVLPRADHLRSPHRAHRAQSQLGQARHRGGRQAGDAEEPALALQPEGSPPRRLEGADGGQARGRDPAGAIARSGSPCGCRRVSVAFVKYYLVRRYFLAGLDGFVYGVVGAFSRFIRIAMMAERARRARAPGLSAPGAHVSHARARRGIAQPGSAEVLGTSGRRFESCCPDQLRSPPEERRGS